ncbi:regulator of volume decrease after cellular swelling-domain-containing protein [Aspergillus aurantiobrunneus]
MEPLTSPPDTSAFIPLSVHQSRTPESFHYGPAILHYHASNCKLVGLERDLSSTPTLNALRGAAVNVPSSNLEHHEGNAANGRSETETEKEIVIEGLDVWVTSDKFLLYNTSTSTGLSIPYRSISLHAIQRLKLPTQDQPIEVQGLYMHITKTPSPASFPQESDEEESLTVTLVPPTTTPATPSGNADAEPELETETQKLYAAVSACANLHPDPVEEEDEDGGAFTSGFVFSGAAEGGLPPPVDGSSGWITADNMHEFFDEDGNWIGEGEGPSMPGLGNGLGPGAGTVRERDEGNEQSGADGDDAGVDDETKWRRID